jgi:peroxiredoxin
MSIRVAFLITAFLLLLSADPQFAKPPETVASEQINPGPGMPAPGWQLTDINGETVQLSDFKGNVVILDFWATWYPQSKAETSALVAVQRKEKDKGLVVVGIAVDDGGTAAISKFMKSHPGINYPILIGNDMVRSQYGGIANLPTTFIIGRDGIIASVHQGPIGNNTFKKDLKKLL